MKQPVCVFFAAGRTGAGGETCARWVNNFLYYRKNF